MQHKNNINSSLLAITEQCKCISDSLKQKTDLELVDLAQSSSAQSASAKTLLIRRYLPKILKESKKIFNGQTRNFWDMDDIIQTGIKGILYAINSFDTDRSEGFTTVVCLNISKYLNKKKTNYDPMLQFNKGPEFKRVFYNYFKALKTLKKQNNGKRQLKTEDILKKFNCSLDTLEDVQYAHQTAGNLILNAEDKSNSSNSESGDDEDTFNLIDHATSHETIDPAATSGKIGKFFPIVNLPEDPAIQLEKKQEARSNGSAVKARNITRFKNLLTNKEWLCLSLLNQGYKKEKILNQLDISKQRFSFLKKEITKKIQTKKNKEMFTN